MLLVMLNLLHQKCDLLEWKGPGEEISTFMFNSFSAGDVILRP